MIGSRLYRLTASRSFSPEQSARGCLNDPGGNSVWHVSSAVNRTWMNPTRWNIKMEKILLHRDKGAPSIEVEIRNAPWVHYEVSISPPGGVASLTVASLVAREDRKDVYPLPVAPSSLDGWSLSWDVYLRTYDPQPEQTFVVSIGIKQDGEPCAATSEYRGAIGQARFLTDRVQFELD